VGPPLGLVGREAELAVVAAAVRELSGGRASALAIEGEAGIGTTRLVQRLVDDARARGVTVFCGQAHPFERSRPFGVVATALDLNRRSPDPRKAAIGGLRNAGIPQQLKQTVLPCSVTFGRVVTTHGGT
jgi:predicted ATPase